MRARQGPGRLSPRGVALLQAALADGRSQAREALEAGGTGRACAETLSARSTISSGRPRLAARWLAPAPTGRLGPTIVAVGGYGRGCSRRFRHRSPVPPARQAHAGVEKVVEALLYVLWDLKLKVGHATRTVDECLKQARADMTIRTTLVEARFVIGDKALFETLSSPLRQGNRRQDRRRFRRREARRTGGPSQEGGSFTLSCRAQCQGRQGGLARPQYVVLDRQIRLPGPQRAGARRRRSVLAARIRALPPLRGISVDGALPASFSCRPGRGAPEFRRPAAHRSPARLFDSRGPDRCRAVHEALFPHRQGCRRFDRDRVRGARGPPREADARVRPPDRTPAKAHARDRGSQGFQGRQRSRQRDPRQTSSSAIQSISSGSSGSPTGRTCRSIPTRPGSSRSP